MSTKKLQIVGGIIPQPDWEQEDSTQHDFIKNKPDIAAALEGKVGINDISQYLKTINGESIVGTGNITISGGSGGGASVEALSSEDYETIMEVFD